LTKIRRSIQRIKTEEMAQYSLKAPHVSCLYYLYKEGEMTATELCEICVEDKAAISRSIVQLEKDGYVEYSSNSPKKYRTHIMLTDSGRIIAEEISNKVNEIIEIVGSGLTVRERIIFYRSLATINRNLEEFFKKYDEFEVQVEK
jgi:DNA-binding MarR family transcriptional regulator